MYLSWARFIFQSNYSSFILIFFLIVFIKTNRTFSHESTAKFIISLVLSMILVVSDNTRYYTSHLSAPNIFRYLSAAVGYSIRPAIMLVLTYIAARHYKTQNWIICLPVCINAAISFLSCFGPTKGIMFYFDSSNVFQRGIFSYIPYITCLFYSFLFIYYSIKSYRFNAYETIVVSLINIAGFISALIESIAKMDLILAQTMIIGIIFYYLFLNVQVYKRDTLTQFENRRCFYLDLNRHLNQTIIIVEMDLNNLKYYNDTFGHSAGDKALVTVADCMRKIFTKSAALYRFGGDEFMAVFFKKNLEEVTNIVALFQKELEKTEYRVACGIEELKPKDNIDSVVSNLDKKMYENKALLKQAAK